MKTRLAWLRIAIVQGFVCLLCQVAWAAGENSTPAAPPPAQTASGPAINYQGAYGATVSGGVLLMSLQQSGTRIVGRLNGLKSAFEMTGDLQADGRLLGIARSATGMFYFAGQKNGPQIQMMFAEPAADGNIKMETARYITFAPGSPTAASSWQAPARQNPAAAQALAQAAPSAMVSTRQCSQSNSACMTACSKVGGGIAGMNQCIARRCTPDYQKCMGGRSANVTAGDRAWANQLSSQSAQIHQQQMQTYQQQIDSTAQFSRQQEERLNRERFGN